MNSQLFLILGAAGSGRAVFLAGLLEENSRLIVHVDEKAAAIAAGIPPGNLVPWKWIEGCIAIGGNIPPGSEIFFMAHGHESPITLVEGIRDWMEGKPVELSRILTVVNCRLLYKNEKLGGWYDACIHFSDVVLLGVRKGVPNRWVDGFINSYRVRNFPCIFRLIKKNFVDRPGDLLIPEARRISLAFEDPEDAWDEQGNPIVESYFERDEAGRRTKWVPEITVFLERQKSQPDNEELRS